MSHTNSNLLFFLFCSVGAEVFAFTPVVLCVNLCYEFAFVLLFCSTECVERLSERQTETKRKVKVMGTGARGRGELFFAIIGLTLNIGREN